MKEKNNELNIDKYEEYSKILVSCVDSPVIIFHPKMDLEYSNNIIEFGYGGNWLSYVDNQRGFYDYLNDLA